MILPSRWRLKATNPYPFKLTPTVSIFQISSQFPTPDRNPMAVTVSQQYEPGLVVRHRAAMGK